MLTARDAVQDRVYGLDSGADDYLPKPFALDELMARLRVLVRRGEVISGTRLAYADLSVDVSTREVHRGTREVVLTKLEFDLLELLVENPRRVISRTQIVDRVWNDQSAPSDNALDVVVSGLRRKLEEGKEPRLLQTVRGIGYTLRETS
jgi:two-component system response regulator MprA